MNNATFQSLITSATAFGTGNEIDLLTTGNFIGITAQSGNWHIAVSRRTTEENDAFSFDLDQPIVSGQSYNLDFFARAVTLFAAGNGEVEVGISSSSNSFGSLVFSGVPSTVAWTHFNHVFVSPSDAQYLTVRTGPDTANTWNHVDNFTLTAVPEPDAFALFFLGMISIAVARSYQSCTSC
jgi:hypothetical protein